MGVEFTTPPGCPPCEAVDEKVTEEQIATRTYDTGTLHLGWTGSSETKREESKVTDNARPGWRLSLGAGWSAVQPRPDSYRLELSRRLVGTVWLGAWASTDKTAGLSLAMEW